MAGALDDCLAATGDFLRLVTVVLSSTIVLPRGAGFLGEPVSVGSSALGETLDFFGESVGSARFSFALRLRAGDGDTKASFGMMSTRTVPFYMLCQ